MLLKTWKAPVNLPNYDFIFRNTRWFYVEDKIITINKYYAMNGCSSSPDFKKALPGCLVHDALRQAIREDSMCPFDGMTSDRIFYEVMVQFDFNFSQVYFKAVNGFLGKIYNILNH